MCRAVTWTRFQLFRMLSYMATDGFHYEKLLMICNGVMLEFVARIRDEKLGTNIAIGILLFLR